MWSEERCDELAAALVIRKEADMNDGGHQQIPGRQRKEGPQRARDIWCDKINGECVLDK